MEGFWKRDDALGLRRFKEAALCLCGSECSVFSRRFINAIITSTVEAVLLSACNISSSFVEYGGVAQLDPQRIYCGAAS